MKRYFFNYNYEKALFGSKGEKILSENEKKLLLSLVRKVDRQKILDLGTGSGRMASVLLNCGAEVHGIDASREMLQQARTKIKSEKYKLYLGDISDLGRFKDNSFDQVICFRVLKYVDNKGKVLSEVKRVLKDNGFFILEISNKFSFEIMIRWFDLIKSGKSDRYELIDVDKMVKTLKKIGFDILTIKPTTKLPHLFWRKLGSPANFLDKILKIITPVSFLSRGLVIKARIKPKEVWSELVS